MSLPSPATVRSRINSIEHYEIRTCYQATYLFCARIGEVIAYKYPTDKTAHPTGSQLSVRTETYTVNSNIKEEYNAAFFTLLNMNRVAPTMEQIMSIKEPAAIFTVTTEKRRGGWTREIGLPLNPAYEPWTQQLLNYFQTHKGDSALFPFRRQEIYPIAQEAFKGLKVHIQPYERAERDEVGNYIYEVNGNGSRQLKTKTVPAHNKPFSQHALRKVRRTELEEVYGFTSEERKRYGGWSLGIEERYSPGGWNRKSFPKLLQPRTF